MSIGTKIILEGEKEYRSAIYNVNKSISTLRSEMRAVTAEFDGNANSVDALTKKNEVLSKQQAEQEKRVKLLRGALENATKVYGENSNQVLDWQRKLNNASAQLLKLNRDLENNEKYMKEAEESTDKTAKSIDEYGKHIEGASEKTSIFGDVLKANLLSNAIQDGAKKLARELGAAVEQSIELASDLEEVQNVVDVTFGEGADTIDKWAESIGMAHGVSVLYAKEYVGTMGAMLKSMDLTDEKVMEMSTNLVQLAGDMASFYNVDTQTMFEKIRSGISGQIVPLQQLGIDLRVSSLEAHALAEGIEKTYSEMSHAEQAVLRYDYLMKLTADAQGDFARNIDSLANQQRVAELQREEILMKLGEAVIPAVTRATVKLNEAMEGTGDGMAAAAEILAEGIVDGLVWIIDNADTVIAGLKGISMALITKKAADGVVFLINAYGTLTTATKEATKAQVAFNTASKANIIGALVSAVVGVSMAIYSYAKSARSAADETDRLSEKTKELVKDSKEAREEIDKRVDAWAEETNAIETQYLAMDKLADKLYSLADKENKTNSEKEQMVALVKQLNEQMPELNLQIDEQTGLLSKQKDELKGLISAKKEHYLVQAAEQNYTKIAEQMADAELRLSTLRDEYDRKKNELEELNQEGTILMDSLGGISSTALDSQMQAIRDTSEQYEILKAEVKALNIEIEGQEEVLARSDKQWQANEEYIKRYTGSLKATEQTLDSFTDKYQKMLDEQTKTEVGTLEDRQKQINKIYEETGRELDKQLRTEEREFRKSQQRRVEEVKKSQQAELKEIEKAHNTKIDLINKEYLEKIKTVDEDRYKELKRIQDELDAIDTQQEAEDRAIEAREEAEKKAELQLRVEQAKTVEERMDAQKELQRHEERVARNRLKEERNLQKDVLKEQKDTINKSYDEKIKSIEAEQKAEQDKLNEQFAREKEALEERYKLKLEVLKDEQELERDALKDRQTEYKNFLRDQRELAIANSKEIYEADLAEFKMAQALKYEEVMSSEEQMKRAIQEYAYKSMQPGPTRDKVLRSNDLNEMLQHYNPSSALQSSAPQTASIDYGLVEDAMSRALRNLNLSIKLDKRTLGQVIDERINYNLRR